MCVLIITRELDLQQGTLLVLDQIQTLSPLLVSLAAPWFSLAVPWARPFIPREWPVLGLEVSVPSQGTDIVSLSVSLPFPTHIPNFTSLGF